MRHLFNKTTLGGYLQKILTASVYDVAIQTPLQFAPSMSSRLGRNIFLKREDLQPNVFSFKIRGAYNCIVNLPEERRKNGIVACSAGNHAQGVALSARKLGLDAVIVMPTATAAIKVDSVKKLGGNVILSGDNFDEAYAVSMELVKKEGRTLIHPFDDPHVIAGQGTVGMEIINERNGQPLDAVFVCCGGGGLLAGIAAYIKSVRPSVRVIGVEAEDAAGMTTSLRHGSIVSLDTVGIFADGAAVKTVGTETFNLCNNTVDEMITVSTDEICAAIKQGFNETRSVLEPAGALAIAGIERYVKNGGTLQTLVAITSGANMDFDRLRFVSERADATEFPLSINIPEEPGSFKKLYSMIYPRNVTEFSYRYGSKNLGAQLFCSFQAKDEADAQYVLETLHDGGYPASSLQYNELALGHARYLVGGRSLSPDDNELLYRFEFPERPGALKIFLDKLSPIWNISLFHYRNHGADVGRVLVGVQVPPDQLDAWQAFLNQLGYTFFDETNNIVYDQFLK